MTEGAAAAVASDPATADPHRRGRGVAGGFRPLQPGTGRVRGVGRRRRQARARAVPHRQPALVILDLMLPELSGLGRVPRDPRGVRRPDHRRDREGLRSRQGDRTRTRRRRLRDEALLGSRARLEGAGASAPSRHALREPEAPDEVLRGGPVEMDLARHEVKVHGDDGVPAEGVRAARSFPAPTRTVSSPGCS